MIYAPPNTQITALLDGGTPNLGNALLFSIINADSGVVVLGYTHTGVSEIVVNGVHTGSYIATFTTPATEDHYILRWDDGSGSGAPYLDDLVVDTEDQPGDGTYIVPNQPFVAAITDLASGLTSLNVALLQIDGTTIISSFTDQNIEEIYPGTYVAQFDDKLAIGNYLILWYDGSGYYVDQLRVVVDLPIGSTQYGIPLGSITLKHVTAPILGSTIGLQAEFRDRKGQLLNPDVITGWVKVPQIDTPVLLQFLMRQPGIYETSYVITKDGTFYWRVEGTYIGEKMAKERKFEVKPEKVIHT